MLCFVNIALTAALVVLTALALASHFLPQTRSPPLSTDNMVLQLYYSRLVLRVPDTDGGRVESYITASQFLKTSKDADGSAAYRAMGGTMVAAQFFAALGTVAGFLAAIVSLLTIVGSQPAVLRVTRAALTGLAFVSCLITTAVVADRFHGELGVSSGASVVASQSVSLKLVVGFGFICVAFCGYLIVFAVDVALMVCECLCRPRVSRNAWNGGAGDDTRTYGSRLPWVKE